MAIPLASNFDLATSQPIDSYTRFATKSDMLSCSVKKPGVFCYVVDEEQHYYLNHAGGEYVKAGSDLSALLDPAKQVTDIIG